MTVKKPGDEPLPVDPEAPPEGSAATDTPPPDGFRSFMVELATDPARLGAYIRDPDATMATAGIDPVDQAILKGGQPWVIHARLMGQRFSFDPPPTPAAVLVVDMVRPPDAPEGAGADQPTVRGAGPAAGPGSSSMFPNAPVQFPQITPPQVVVQPQIFPQIFPQILPQIVHPQVVVHPQIFPQIHPQIVHPQVVVHPQIFPQIHPQIFPQIHPQIVHPQVVVHPQIFPQILPQIVHPQILPQIVHPQIFPQVFPQIFPQFTPGATPGS